MKKLIHRLTVILMVGLGFMSCSHKDESNQEAENATIDFGSGTYRPTPFHLDDVIPFSWLGMPDSVKKEAEIVISFNEDAIRSQSKGNIYLVDSNGNRVNGIHIGSLQGEEVAISAGKKEITLPITYRVNPEVGDSLLKGYVMVVGDKLDEVNDTQLIASATPIGDWQLKHKTGINWWRWLLLILVVALILTIIFLIGYGLVKAFIVLFEYFSKYLYNRKRKIQKRKFQEKKQKKENNENPYLRLIKQKCLPDVYELVLRINKRGKIHLSIDNLRVSELTNGEIEIWFDGSDQGEMTRIRVDGDKIYAIAGSLPGKESPQNQFLNELLPNKTYYIDDSAAIYHTDAQGRVYLAEGNRTKLLKIKRAGRNTPTQSDVTKGVPGYDGGHLFDCYSGGANEYVNQVPMESNLNRNGQWKQMEAEEKKLANSVESCTVKRKIIYSKFSRNPHIPKEIISMIYVNGNLYKKITIKNPKPDLQ